MTNILPELELLSGHESIYRKADLEYIIRILRKVSNKIMQERDSDWAQLYIESFLLLNSRIYDGLLKIFVNGIEKYYRMPKDYLYGKFDNIFETSRSYEYHKQRRIYRVTAAHSTNYLRVTVLDFGGVLPYPINYRQTQSLLYNAMSKDLLEMWSIDIALCADEIEKNLTNLISELNKIDKKLFEEYSPEQIEENIFQFFNSY